MLVTPYYNRPTQEGLFEHYSAIAAAVPDFPIILYNVPCRTGCDLLPATIGRLSKIDSIIGIKDASGDVNRIPELVALCRVGFRVFAGDDGLALSAILSGAHGVISVAGNVNPELMAKMVAAALRKDEAAARQLDDGMKGLYTALFVESNPIPTKWLLADMKKCPGGIRLPLLPLSAKHHQVLLEAYRLSCKSLEDHP